MTERERDTHKRENRALNVLSREPATTRQLWQVGGSNAILAGLESARLIDNGGFAAPNAVWILTPAGLRERDRRVANGLGWTV